MPYLTYVMEVNSSERETDYRLTPVAVSVSSIMFYKALLAMYNKALINYNKTCITLGTINS